MSKRKARSKPGPSSIIDGNLNWNSLTEEPTKLLKISIIIDSAILCNWIYWKEIIWNMHTNFHHSMFFIVYIFIYILKTWKQLKYTMIKNKEISTQHRMKSCTIKHYSEEEYDMRKYLWNAKKQDDTSYNDNLKKMQNTDTHKSMQKYSHPQIINSRLLSDFILVYLHLYIFHVSVLNMQALRI